METSNGVKKKIIIGGIGLIIILAAVLTVLNNRMFRTKNYPTSDYLGGKFVTPQSTGLSSGSFGISSLKGGLATRESFSEPAPTVGDVSTDIDKKIIKNGFLTMRVSSADKASENIGTIAKNNGGDVFSSNFYKNPQTNVKSGTITIKVPVANFEKTLTEIKKVAALVLQESTSGQDVTEEYADLQAQLKNKQAEEQQFQNILNQAQKIQDILDVTQQLSRVRGEIEQLQGRIKFLSSQTDMSSITVTLSEDQNITISDTWRPLQVIKDAINLLLSKIRGFVNFAIVLVITVIPVAILYLLLVYVIYWIGRKIYFKLRG